MRDRGGVGEGGGPALGVLGSLAINVSALDMAGQSFEGSLFCVG
jgi:hypothetical protein